MTPSAAPPTPNAKPRAPYDGILSAILAAGVLLRLWAAIGIPTQPISDFSEYLRSAQSLFRTGRYEIAVNAPNGSHPPAYPLLLSMGFRLAPTGDQLIVAKLINAGLFVLAALFGSMLARRFWGEASGLWTAAWIAFLPRSILMGDLIASENLFSPLLLLFLLLCAISWTGGRRLALAAAIGAVVGTLTLTRSVAYLLPLVWCVGALAARRPRRAWTGEMALLLAAQHAVMLPWAIRNAHALGRFTWTNTVGGVGLFIGNNANATGEWYPWAGDLERLRPGIQERGAVAVDDAARQEAWRWIRENPGRALRLYAHKLRLILSDDSAVASFAILIETTSPPDFPSAALPGPHALKNHATAVRRVLRVSGLALAAAGLGGWIILLGRARTGSSVDRALAAGFCAAALYVPLLSAAIAVNGRYRWPVEDAIMPLAGLLVSRLAPRPSRKAVAIETP